MSKGQQNGMAPNTFAEKMLRGVEKQKQELYIGGKEVWGVYLKRFAPRTLNRLLRMADVT